MIMDMDREEARNLCGSVHDICMIGRPLCRHGTVTHPWRSRHSPLTPVFRSVMLGDHITYMSNPTVAIAAQPPPPAFLC